MDLSFARFTDVVLVVYVFVASFIVWQNCGAIYIYIYIFIYLFMVGQPPAPPQYQSYLSMKLAMNLLMHMFCG